MSKGFVLSFWLIQIHSLRLNAWSRSWDVSNVRQKKKKKERKKERKKEK
jgi:hypothetical protein